MEFHVEVVDLLLRDVFQRVEAVDIALADADLVEVGKGGARGHFGHGFVVLGNLVGVVELGHIQHLGGGAHVHAAVSHALHVELVGEEGLVILAVGNLLTDSGLYIIMFSLHLFDHVLLDGHGQSVVLGGQCAVELRHGERLLVVAIHLVADVQRDDRAAFLFQIVGIQFLGDFAAVGFQLRHGLRLGADGHLAVGGVVRNVFLELLPAVGVGHRHLEVFLFALLLEGIGEALASAFLVLLGGGVPREVERVAHHDLGALHHKGGLVER